MALYYVKLGDEGLALVRAKNGRRAMDIVGDAATDVCRVHEDGDEGLVLPDFVDATEPSEQRERREIEITNVSDVGIRRFKDLDTGEERTEPRSEF